MDEALLCGTFDVGGDTMEGPMSYSVTEAAIMPLWTVLIDMVCPIPVTLPTVIPGDAGAYLSLPLFDASLLQAPYGVGTMVITPPLFWSTVAAGTYTVARVMINPLLLVSIVT